jgi:hypothetical protein
MLESSQHTAANTCSKWKKGREYVSYAAMGDEDFPSTTVAEINRNVPLHQVRLRRSHSTSTNHRKSDSKISDIHLSNILSISNDDL